MKDSDLDKKVVEHLAVMKEAINTISCELARFREGQKLQQWLIVTFIGLTAIATVIMAIKMILH